MPLDVAVSGVNGSPVQFAGMTMSQLPIRAMAKKTETYWVPQHITPSGLEQKYTDRFDNPTYYTA